MSDALIPDHESLFRRTLKECRRLYVSSGTLCASQYPHLLAVSRGGKTQSAERFVALMDDLHRALVLKVYFSICEADRQWSSQERHLAEELFEHLWGQRLTGEKLRTVARRLSEDAMQLKWYSLVRPFDQIVPLRDHIGTLETLVMRLANIVARADGQLHPKEAAVIKSIQEELHRHLRPIPIDQPNQHEQTNAIGNRAIESLQAESDGVYAATRIESPDDSATLDRHGSRRRLPAEGQQPPQASLEETLGELDSLIGLEQIKHEVRTLTNFLKLQQRRGAAGLPGTELSLHMVFTGNPGTGKTSVARILGKIFGLLGVLKKGHLVETDRSGLVAEYAGQTGPKTHAKINEALDGVLFVDEAYSLAFHQGQDLYGNEAVQVLLKRAEDDRERLVVILAGYPAEMHRLLRTNPGLSSRFSRVLHFPDYSSVELARIFGSLCDKNHYRLSACARAKLMLGLAELHGRRDRHFGNGRAVRNLFEHTVRRMANRIAEIPKLSREQLMLLEDADVEFTDLPDKWMKQFDGREPKFRIVCPGCSHTCDAPGTLLGRNVRCAKCQHKFMAEWGEPVTAQEPA